MADDNSKIYLKKRMLFNFIPEEIEESIEDLEPGLNPLGPDPYAKLADNQALSQNANTKNTTAKKVDVIPHPNATVLRLKQYMNRDFMQSNPQIFNDVLKLEVLRDAFDGLGSLDKNLSQEIESAIQEYEKRNQFKVVDND